MKIKTQFSIFLIGIILLPIFIVCITIFIGRSSKESYTKLLDYSEIIGNENSDFTVNPETWQKVQNMIWRKPGHIEYSIFDNNLKTIISSIPHFQEKHQYSEEYILQTIEENCSDFLYQIEFVQAEDTSSSVWLISRVSRQELHRPERYRNPAFYTSMIFSVLFAFCIIMILLITHSITKSVTYLEQYTKEIASGNLDLIAKSKPSNSNEIISLTDSVNTMRNELLENENSRMRFIMGISHDLRTPIALIKGYAEALKDGIFDDAEARKNSLAIIISKSDLLNERIDELIDFAKLNTAEWQKNLEFHDMKKFLIDFSKRFELDAQLMHKDFSTDIQLTENTQVKFDEKLFSRVLENLLGNACRYTSLDGKIQLSAKTAKNTKSDQEKILISISDNGIGIKNNEMPYIFDPLWRSSSSRQEDGKGLGLSIVRSIVQSHGWKISAASNENSGSVFTIEI